MLKKCTKCGEEKPATTEFFYKDRRWSNLVSACKTCISIQGKKRRGTYDKYVPPEGYRVCTRCKKEFPATLDHFNKASNNKIKLTAQCKACLAIRRKELRKPRTNKQRERHRVYTRQRNHYLKENEPEKYKKQVLETSRRYRENPKNNQKILECKYRWRQKQRGNVRYRLERNLRHRVYKAIRGNSKSKPTLELLGCTVEEVKVHLEDQFWAGMSWENYGEWHIDHIKPCAKFDLTKPEEQQKCFHYTNLQPLWAEHNLSKGATHVEEDIQ